LHALIVFQLIDFFQETCKYMKNIVMHCKFTEICNLNKEQKGQTVKTNNIKKTTNQLSSENVEHRKGNEITRPGLGKAHKCDGNKLECEIIPSLS